MIPSGLIIPSSLRSSDVNKGDDGDGDGDDAGWSVSPTRPRPVTASQEKQEQLPHDLKSAKAGEGGASRNLRSHK